MTRDEKTGSWVEDPAAPMEPVTARPAPETAPNPLADAKSPEPEKSEKPAERAAQPKPAPTDVATLLQTLNSRLDSMENKIGSLNDRVEVIAFQKEVDSRAPVKKQPVPAQPAVETVGALVSPSLGDTDPDAGFVQDPAVAQFREGIVLMRASQYDQAIVKFSGIVDRFAEHTLAGSAQYYVGEAYYRKGEHALAVQEFQRVLNAYDRSPHVSSSLERVARCYDKLGKTVEAERARQQLESMFPQSPAALAAQEAAPSADPIQRANAQLQRAEAEIQNVEKRLQAIDKVDPVPAAPASAPSPVVPTAPARGPSASESSVSEPVQQPVSGMDPPPPTVANAAEPESH